MQEYIDTIRQIKGDFCRSVFESPASDSEIAAFSQSHHIQIPPSYQAFLRISNGASLFGGNAALYGVGSAKYLIGYDFSENGIPDAFLPIGYKDSAHICYETAKNRFLFYEYEDLDEIESECIFFDDFEEILAYLIDIYTS